MSNIIISSAIRKTLSLEEKLQIEKLLKDGLSCCKIARILGKGKNSIIVEVRRNGGKEEYTAERSEKRAGEYKDKRKFNGRVFTESEKTAFLQFIKEDRGNQYIRKELKLSYIALFSIYKQCNMKAPSLYAMLGELSDKIYALEEQIKILFEMVEK